MILQKSESASDAITPCAVGIDSLYLGHFPDGLGIDWEKPRATADADSDYAVQRLAGRYHSPDLWRSDVAEKARKRELGL